MWVITSLLEIEQLWNKASLFKSAVRIFLAAESEDCGVESLHQFLSRLSKKRPDQSASPCPGERRAYPRTYGAAGIGTSKVSRGQALARLLLETTKDGLGKFYD